MSIYIDKKGPAKKHSDRKSHAGVKDFAKKISENIHHAQKDTHHKLTAATGKSSYSIPNVLQGSGNVASPYSSRNPFYSVAANVYTPLSPVVLEPVYGLKACLVDILHGEIPTLIEHGVRDHFSEDAARFKHDREQLLKENGFQTTYAVAGALDGKKWDEAASFSKTLALNWAKNNFPVDADPYTRMGSGLLTNFGVSDEDYRRFVRTSENSSAPPHTTKAVVDAASLKEMVDMILIGAKDKTQTDLIIHCHGNNLSIAFAEKKQDKILYSITSKEIQTQFMRLKPILKPGSQIYLAACNLASDQKSQQEIQNLANMLGVRIIACENIGYTWHPLKSEAINFYPQTGPRLESKPIYKKENRKNP